MPYSSKELHQKFCSLRSDLLRIDISNILNPSDKSNTSAKTSKAMAMTGKYILPEKGQILEGKILDILQSRVTIQLLNGQQMSAKMLEAMPFKIGDNLLFEVKDSTQDQLTLRPIIQEQTLELNSAQILSNAGLDQTSENMDIVKALLENSMPVNKESVLQMHRFVKRFPEAKLETLIFMEKNDVIISKESIQHIDSLLADQQNMSKALASFSQMASQTIKEPQVFMLLEALVRDNPSSHLMLKSALALVEGQEVHQNEPIHPQQLEQVETTLRQQVLPQLSAKDQTVLSDALTQLKNVKTLQGLLDFFEALPIEKEHIKETLAQRLTEQVLNQNLLLGRKDLEQHERISKHFNKVYERLSDLIETASQQELNSSGEKVLKQAQQLKTGMDVMNQLQQNYQFIHLPIMLNQQFINSQLYIMNKKGTRKNSDERITALLRLDFRNLGHMDIYIAKHMKNVDITFYVDGQDTETLLQENTTQLYKQLINQSFNIVGLGIRLHDADVQEIREYFDPQKTKTEPKRFTFDVRA